jgi:hypothetical protein
MRLLRAVKASLSADKPAYFVGDQATYRIIAAKPGARVLWSTWKNGESLEYEKSNGEVIGGNGTAELTHPAFADEDVGYWERIVSIVNDADGTRDAAQIFFTVSPVTPPASTLPATIPQPQGFFDQTMNLFGTQVPTWLVIGGGIFLFIKLTKK